MKMKLMFKVYEPLSSLKGNKAGSKNEVLPEMFGMQ